MINSIRLQNFRSYNDDSYEFSDGVNIIVGPNASGKTNLLEALLVVARGKSYRGQDKELVRHNKDWSRLDAATSKGIRTIKLQTNGKTYEIDSHVYKRLPYAQKLPVVLFEPNNLRLLNGAPENRRELIDNILEQLDEVYGETSRRYQRTLAQRNSLLKHKATTGKDLFVWDVRLSEYAQKIVQTRLDLIDIINKKMTKLYKTIANQRKATVVISYESVCGTANYAGNMLKQLESKTQEDIARGFTTVGPHRDDIKITLNGQPASQTASRGETRTLLLVLKIIELELLEGKTGQKPLLLLDDVFSELDGARRQALTKKISNHQTFITTTDADVVVQHFMDNCHIIPLS